MSHEWRRGEYLISTDRARLDVALVHKFLSESSYWATGRPRAVVERSIEHSLAFGIYRGERPPEEQQQQQQIGFGRVITDYATFAWIADVFVLDEFRGRGLGRWLSEVMIAHPDLQGFRRWALATKDAHELYRRVGFQELQHAARWMERHDPQTVERPDYWAEEPGA